MILCIDIGNTNIKYGIFKKDKLVASFRVASKRTSTADEYGVIVRDLLASASIDRNDIEGIIMSSVIPQLNYTMEHMCEYYFGRKPLVVGPGIKTGLNIKVDNPKEVGADRIVNSIAAYKLYGGKKPIICIDFGTATTFNVISASGELLGGVIAPGIKGSLDSLVNGTAKLPNIELELPGKVICKDTVTNMQAGLLYGFAGLVDGIVGRIRRELGVRKDGCIVVATGGLGSIIAKEADIDITDRTLTLVGLRLLYEMNALKSKETNESEDADAYENYSCSFKSNNMQNERMRSAMKLAAENGKITISVLQRKLGMGYTSAAKTIEDLEKCGYIESDDGKSFRISKTAEDFEKDFGKVKNTRECESEVDEFLSPVFGRSNIPEARIRDAMRTAIKGNSVSISLLQRKFCIGYPAAGKLIDELMDRGYISRPEDASGYRVLMTAEEFEKIFGEEL